MFSVTNTGTCRRPSCTAMVRPTISGMIVEARDQVRITARELVRWTASTFFMSLASMNGPFLVERDTRPLYFLFRRRTMSLSLCFLPRVR